MLALAALKFVENSAMSVSTASAVRCCGAGQTAHAARRGVASSSRCVVQGTPVIAAWRWRIASRGWLVVVGGGGGGGGALYSPSSSTPSCPCFFCCSVSASIARPLHRRHAARQRLAAPPASVPDLDALLGGLDAPDIGADLTDVQAEQGAVFDVSGLKGVWHGQGQLQLS